MSVPLDQKSDVNIYLSSNQNLKGNYHGNRMPAARKIKQHLVILFYSEYMYRLFSFTIFKLRVTIDQNFILTTRNRCIICKILTVFYQEKLSWRYHSYRLRLTYKLFLYPFLQEFIFAPITLADTNKLLVVTILGVLIVLIIE